MRILSGSSILLPLLRRRKVALVHRLSPPSRTLLSAPARWWPPAFPRRVAPVPVASNPLAWHVYRRFPHGSRHLTSSGLKSQKSGKENSRLLVPSAKDLRACSGDVHPVHAEEETEDASLEVLDGKRNGTGEIMDKNGCELSSDPKHSWIEEISIELIDDLGYILPNTRHRDGSIYEEPNCWKEMYCLADRNETRFEAMMQSDPTNCVMSNGSCLWHTSVCMLQFLSLKLVEVGTDYGPVELYGYIAVRDNLDPLLNYIINISRDDPITVEQGSFINITGPKRGIELVDSILIEYDMKIKTGELEKDDLQLVDGLSPQRSQGFDTCYPFISHIKGGCGTIEISAAVIPYGVEATVEVLVSEVQSYFSMCLGCFVSGLHEEIRLFDGFIGESRGLKRSVVAVNEDTWMDLKFKLGTQSFHAEHCRSFKADMHGHAIQEIKTAFALISVKVSWSSLSDLTYTT
ncbi:hypothetical protein ACP4OV_009538 [Aristida adscensionis]